MKTKVCDKCGEEKPLTEFGHDKSSHDGYKIFVNLVEQDI